MGKGGGGVVYRGVRACVWRWGRCRQTTESRIPLLRACDVSARLHFLELGQTGGAHGLACVLVVNQEGEVVTD